MNNAYLRSLKLRGLQLENNIFQAPLAGYSSAPFRKLTWEIGRPGLLATEMISAKALMHEAPKQERYLAKAEGEGPVAFQLWGCEPEAVEVATKIVVECGADVVDLNCGCPVRKVRAAGAGSKLMEDSVLVGKLAAAMRRATDIPVTVKIRVGTSGSHYNGVEVARAAEQEGVDLVTVHGRHAKERYSHAVRYDYIHDIVEALSIPVIGNGDVRDAESARRMFECTGCAGVMVGRACMGAPWVFGEIIGGLSGEGFSMPSRGDIGRILLEHYDLLVGLVGKDIAIRQCRKLGSFYSKGLSGAKEFRNRINSCHERDDLLGILQKYFLS